jgi:1-acyl-sn-glycerol-3-phosphate acyltransferase
MAGFHDRLSYARSILITAPLIFAATALMGSVSLACSVFDTSGKLQHRCARAWARTLLWIFGVRLNVTGFGQLRPEETYIFCANHQSQIDTPIMLVALPMPFRFAAKKELFRIPFLGWHLHRSGQIPIDRRNPHTAVKAIRDAGGKLRKGISLVVFPEGGTSRDGAIKPFKAGGFLLASQTGAEIVPVTIRGSRQILSPRSYHVRGGKVDVIIGRPMPPLGEAPADLASRARTQILETFND